MMELLNNIGLGFTTALGFWPLVYCFVGVLLGTLIGILPGLGPAATIAMLLPASYALKPELSLIMLAGIYYGAQYGGSTTAILINTPGEASSVITALDGYPMARTGRGGIALAAAAIGSFIAGSVATFLIAWLAPLLGNIALSFGAADYFSVMVFGLICAIVLASGSLDKSLAMVVTGIFLGTVGTDVTTGAYRFTFGLHELAEGLDLVVVAMGLFGISEVVRTVKAGDNSNPVIAAPVRLMPDWADWRRMMPAILRGTGLGSFLGLLPGGGALLASFASYAVEKRVSRHPEEFGHGAIEGVAGPEAANNAGAQMSFIPMLTLGLPTNAVMALMVGAMMIQGITPGPAVMTERPELFWGLIASMWVGNLLLLILNLPLVGLWVRLLRVPYRVLFPAILVFCCTGAYAVGNSTFNIYLLAATGLVGYILAELEFELAPLILGFLLGPMMEENLHRALSLSDGDWMTFIHHPISAGFLLSAILLVVVSAVPSMRRTRSKLKED